MYTTIRLIATTFCLTASLACAQMMHASEADPSTRSALRVQVLSVGQMLKEDADLLSGHRAEVAEAAEFNGYDLASGSWIQSQVLCPYAPNHVLMHYLKMSPDGSLSLFSALIPRDKGPVRIIPVLYSGGQALRVFGSTPAQRDLINQVISTKVLLEVPSGNADWATLGYCYAALAGGEPSSMSVTTPEETTPRLVLSPDGKVDEMSFTVLGPDRFYQHWRIQFDSRLQVKSIALSAHALHAPHAIPQPQTTPQLQTIPQPQSSPQGRPIPAPQ